VTGCVGVGGVVGRGEVCVMCRWDMGLGYGSNS